VQTTPAIKKLIAVVNDAGEMPRMHGRNHISNPLSFTFLKFNAHFKSKAVLTQIRRFQMPAEMIEHQCESRILTLQLNVLLVPLGSLYANNRFYQLSEELR
jgi:hypothetical protein